MAVFYKVRDLTFAQKKAILLHAKENCQHWWVDILDCAKSCLRQKIDMPFDEIMAKFIDHSLFSIIHRNLEPENYLEIGFRTLTDPNYFLWIILDPSYAESNQEIKELERL